MNGETFLSSVHNGLYKNNAFIIKLYTCFLLKMKKTPTRINVELMSARRRKQSEMSFFQISDNAAP